VADGFEPVKEALGNDSVTLATSFYGRFSPIPAGIFVLIEVGKVETILVGSDPNKGNHLTFAQAS
jgi:hypothetical protein